MELKEYIKEVISQISDATVEINNGTADTTLIVNPSVSAFKRIDGKCYVLYSKGLGVDCCTQIVDIDFDVAVSTSSKNTAGGGVSISVLNLGASKGDENSSVNHVKFSLPVLFPTIRIDRKYPAQDEDSLKSDD